MPTVISINIQDLHGKPQRLSKIARFLKHLDPDCVFIFEIMGGRIVLEDLCHRLGKSWCCEYQANGDSRHVGFCYNERKVQPVRIAWHPFSFPRTNLYQRALWVKKDGSDAKHHRLYALHRLIGVNCTFTSDPSNPVLLLGVHLKSMLSFRDKSNQLSSQEKRSIQVSSIEEFFENWTEHNTDAKVLVFGDFNSESAESCSPLDSSCNETTKPLDQGRIVHHVRPSNEVKSWKGTRSFKASNLDLLYESSSMNASLTVIDSAGLSDHNALKITWGVEDAPKSIGFSLIHLARTLKLAWHGRKIQDKHTVNVRS